MCNSSPKFVSTFQLHLVSGVEAILVSLNIGPSNNGWWLYEFLLNLLIHTDLFRLLSKREHVSEHIFIFNDTITARILASNASTDSSIQMIISICRVNNRWVIRPSSPLKIN
jgi:hypothetical protein